jgi:hypothetical protein
MTRNTKTRTKKLSLSRETLRTLTDIDAQGVNGGYSVGPGCVKPASNQACTQTVSLGGSCAICR